MEHPKQVSAIASQLDLGVTTSSSVQPTKQKSSKTAPSIGNVVPQFINFTDSVSLDKSARTQVRVQVMRDYHRRRIQGEDKGTGSKGEARESMVLTAKSQTHKFRLGREKVLRPWVPVKTPASKRMGSAGDIVGDQGKRKATSKTKSQKSTIPSSSRPREETIDRPQPMSATLEDNTDLQEHLPTQDPVDRWLSDLDVALKSSVLQNSPGSGSLDPFSTAALLITPRTQMLLHHYFNVRLTSAWLMMPMRKSLFSRAIHDTAMFHSFMSHYAAAYNVASKTGDSSESVFHIALSAKLVNQKLADPSQALSDDTVATVANLAAYECSNGSAASMVVHMDGLEKMVQMRGGIFEGGFAPIVQRMIGWTDFHVATALLRKPRFPPLRFADTEEPSATSPSPSHSMSQPAVPTPGITLSTSKLDILLNGVNKLCNTLKALRLRPCMPQENIWYSDKIYHLQRSLFDIAHCTKKESMNFNGSLDALCSLAALIYCGRYLRDIPFSYVVTAHAVTRLKTAIEKHEESYMNVWSESLDVWLNSKNEKRGKMFWVLCFGGIAAEGKSEHPWFLEQAGAQAARMGISSWREARKVLNTVLWQEELDEAGMRLCEAAFKGSDEMSAWVEW